MLYFRHSENDTAIAVFDAPRTLTVISWRTSARAMVEERRRQQLGGMPDGGDANARVPEQKGGEARRPGGIQTHLRDHRSHKPGPGERGRGLYSGARARYRISRVHRTARSRRQIMPFDGVRTRAQMRGGLLPSGFISERRQRLSGEPNAPRRHCARKSPI